MVVGLLLALFQQPAAPVARVEVTPRTAEIQVGGTVRLSARAVDAVGKDVPGVKIGWFGNGEGSVDSTGVVTGGYAGYIEVTAVAQVAGATSPVLNTVTVRVMPLPATKVTVTPWVSKLAPGTRVALVGNAFSSQGDTRYDLVTFTSSNPRAVAITPDGRMRAVAPGKATITAKAGTATESLPVEVVATAVGSVSISPEAKTVRAGDVVHFTLAVKDRAGKPINDLSARWSLNGVTGTGVALVDAEGVFVGETQGKYTVAAEVGSQTAEAVITVELRKVGRGIEVVGRVPIKVRGAEVWVHPSGKCVYYSTIADRVYAIDIANPAKPEIVDSMMVDARITNDVMTTEDGKYGVFSREGNSARKNGIAIFDASNPCHPKVIADYTETVSGGVHSSYVYQGHVYLTDDATGSMRVIDIRDPYHPKEVARWQTEQTEKGRYVHDVAVTDGLAYLAYWNDGLIILDVGNGIKGGSPEHPVKVSQLKYDLNALYARVDQEYGLGARGTHTAWRHKNYVFIADEVYAKRNSTGLDEGNDLTWGRLQVVDVSNIEKPKIVAWYEPTDGGVHNVWVEGDSLYLGNYQGGGRVVDISGELKGDLLRQGREMTWLFTSDDKGTKPRSTFTWGAVVKDGLIFFNDINSGLWIAKMEPKGQVVP